MTTLPGADPTWCDSHIRKIQMDATEMVRRAEYALGKAIRKGQAEGTVATRGTNSGPRSDYLRDGRVVRVDETRPTSLISRPTDYASTSELHGQSGGEGIYALAEADGWTSC